MNLAHKGHVAEQSKTLKYIKGNIGHPKQL